VGRSGAFRDEQSGLRRTASLDGSGPTTVTSVARGTRRQRARLRWRRSRKAGGGSKIPARRIAQALHGLAMPLAAHLDDISSRLLLGVYRFYREHGIDVDYSLRGQKLGDDLPKRDSAR
jgi:hypothetical protein